MATEMSAGDQPELSRAGVFADPCILIEIRLEACVSQLSRVASAISQQFSAVLIAAETKRALATAGALQHRKDDAELVQIVGHRLEG